MSRSRSVPLLLQQSDYPKTPANKNCDIKYWTQITYSHIFTTLISDKSLMTIQHHFLKVFSSAFATECRTCSFEYCFRNNKPHKRWIGFKSTGAWTWKRIFSQTITQTGGVIPKNDLKRRNFVGSFWPALVLVKLFPSFKNTRGVASRKPQEKFTNFS